MNLLYFSIFNKGNWHLFRPNTLHLGMLLTCNWNLGTRRIKFSLIRFVQTSFKLFYKIINNIKQISDFMLESLSKVYELNLLWQSAFTVYRIPRCIRRWRWENILFCTIEFFSECLKNEVNNVIHNSEAFCTTRFAEKQDWNQNWKPQYIAHSYSHNPPYIFLWHFFIFIIIIGRSQMISWAWHIDL